VATFHLAHYPNTAMGKNMHLFVYFICPSRRACLKEGWCPKNSRQPKNMFTSKKPMPLSNRRLQWWKY